MSNTDKGDIKLNSTENVIENSGAPREQLIATAVNFLLNPNVQRSGLAQKQKFLRSKGLKENEIQIACERAGIFTKDPNSTVINMGRTSQTHPPNYLIEQNPMQTLFGRIKETLSSLALLSGLAYALYLFYKKFIESFLFGKKKKKTVEETIQEMDKKVETQIKDLSVEIVHIKDEITSTVRNDMLTREISNFKSDLEAIKGLLLNRKQFANPLPIVPPSIPAWQLTSQRHTETEPDKNDDAGSGSGSSETEVVTKNSDSSLEIM